MSAEPCDTPHVRVRVHTRMHARRHEQEISDSRGLHCCSGGSCCAAVQVLLGRLVAMVHCDRLWSGKSRRKLHSKAQPIGSWGFRAAAARRIAIHHLNPPLGRFTL